MEMSQMVLKGQPRQLADDLQSLRSCMSTLCTVLGYYGSLLN